MHDYCGSNPTQPLQLISGYLAPKVNMNFAIDLPYKTHESEAIDANISLLISTLTFPLKSKFLKGTRTEKELKW